MFYYLISKSSYLEKLKDKYIQVLIYGTISYIILHALLISKSNKFKYLENYFWSIFSIDCISIYYDLKNNMDEGVSINTRQKNAIKKKNIPTKSDNIKETDTGVNKDKSVKNDLSNLSSLTNKLNKLNKLNDKLSTNNITTSPHNNKNIKTDNHTNFTENNTITEIQAVNEKNIMDLNNISNLGNLSNISSTHNMNMNNKNNMNDLNNLSNMYQKDIQKSDFNKNVNINQNNINPYIKPELDINQDIKGVNNLISSQNKTTNKKKDTIISLDTSDEEDEETDVGSDIDINLFEQSL